MEEAQEIREATGHDITEYFERALAERRDGPDDGRLLSMLVRAEVEGRPLTHAELLGTCHLLMLGGLDTVTATLDCMITYLARHPERRQAIVDDPDAHPGRGRGAAAPRDAGDDGAAQDPPGRRDRRRACAGPATARRCSSARATSTRPSSRTPTRCASTAAATGTSRSAADRTAASAPTSRASSCTSRSRSSTAASPSTTIPDGAEINFSPGIRQAEHLPLTFSGLTLGQTRAWSRGIPGHDRALPLGVDAVVAGAAARARRARRTSCSSCSTTSASRSSVASAPTSTRRCSTGSRRGGLRYRNFHTTALCSPTRSCLLTGRNHHANGMGRITDLATGFPGYDGRIPKANALPLRDARPARLRGVGGRQVAPHARRRSEPRRARATAGRSAAASSASTASSAARRTSTRPRSSTTTTSSTPPRSVEDGYHLTEDLVDHAIEFVHDLRQVDPDKPFFLYLAPARATRRTRRRAEWIERYRGRFDAGWDVWREQTLARQIACRAAARRTPCCRRGRSGCRRGRTSPTTNAGVYARYMEAFAGFLSHTDHQVGRFLDALAETGDLDNTLVIVVSDNGASSEGGVAGSLNDVRVWNGAPRTVEEALPVSTRSAARAGTTTTRGAGPSRATRRSGAGSARCTRAASPIR